MKGFLIFIGVMLFIGLFIMGAYNGLVTSSEDVDTQWAQVEAQYQRRFDLIPSLVNSTKGVMTQEREVFGAIAEARTRYAGAPSASNEKIDAVNQMESALSRLLVIMENYPDLKSSETVAKLMDELAGTENRISVERGRFNKAVRAYNLKVKRFPGFLFARMFGFEEKIMFEAEETAENAIEVDLTL